MYMYVLLWKTSHMSFLISVMYRDRNTGHVITKQVIQMINDEIKLLHIDAILSAHRKGN